MNLIPLAQSRILKNFRDSLCSIDFQVSAKIMLTKKLLIYFSHFMSPLYDNRDPRDIPTYSVRDVARYLRIPQGTIRSWILGRKYTVGTLKRVIRG